MYNVRLVREKVTREEIQTVEFWSPARRQGQWIRGCLPSIYLGELILSGHYQWRMDWDRLLGDVEVEGREPWNQRLAATPYDCGVRGVRSQGMVWAAGPDGVERVGKNRFLYQFFESGVQTPAGESWYLQGKGHFF